MTDFALRHLGPSLEDIAQMLTQLGYRTLDEVTDAAIPAEIVLGRSLAR